MRAIMRQSRNDKKYDGTCDVAECKRRQSGLVGTYPCMNPRLVQLETAGVSRYRPSGHRSQNILKEACAGVEECTRLSKF